MTAALRRRFALCALVFGVSPFVLSHEAETREPPLPGPIPASVLSVYDGDTVTVEASIWVGLKKKISVRVNGIDTPEIRGKCEEEKVKALEAKAFVIEWAKSREDQVRLTNVKNGKYAGRVVADIEDADGVVLGQALVNAGLARVYEGGRREGWCES